MSSAFEVHGNLRITPQVPDDLFWALRPVLVGKIEENAEALCKRFPALKDIIVNDNYPCASGQFRLTKAADGSCTFFEWTECVDISYDVEDLINIIAQALCPLGYHIEGKLFLDEERMYYYIVKVKDTKITSKGFYPPCTSFGSKQVYYDGDDDKDYDDY